MRAVVQRVSRAIVTVQGERVGAIDAGLCVLLSVGPADNETVAHRLAARVAGLRVFPDATGRRNLDIVTTGGSVLVVSQFTLHADTSRSHRPSFMGAAAPDLAERLCETFIGALRAHGLDIASGRFGAHMDVELVNDGPVTLVLSSGEGPWPADAG